MPQFALILFMAFDLLNLGYGFDGTFTRLGDFTFVSRAMTGLAESGKPGNRFAGSAIAWVPVPLPRQYVLGIDLQKKDFEKHPDRSYLRGEWKDGGWWYYYLYGLAVKVPHGSQFIVLMATIVVANSRFRGLPIRLAAEVSTADLMVLLAPPLALFVLVSSQLEFNQHFRYVLPVFGFLLVFAGASARLLQPPVLNTSEPCV